MKEFIGALIVKSESTPDFNKENLTYGEIKMKALCYLFESSMMDSIKLPYMLEIENPNKYIPLIRNNLFVLIRLLKGPCLPNVKLVLKSISYTRIGKFPFYGILTRLLNSLSHEFYKFKHEIGVFYLSVLQGSEKIDGCEFIERERLNLPTHLLKKSMVMLMKKLYCLEKYHLEGYDSFDPTYDYQQISDT
jgi:hypothetical protein